MIAYALQGLVLGFAAAVQPGPLQAFLVVQSLTHGWRRTLVFALVPLMSDLPIIAAVLTVLALMPSGWVSVLRVVGGLFLLYLAWGAYRTAKNLEKEEEGADGSPQRGLFQAVMINLLNPNPYLFWSLVTGPILIAGWKESPGHAIAMLAAFYLIMILINAVIILLVSLAHLFDRRVRRILVYASAAGLAAFGAYQLWMGLLGRV